MRYWILDQDDTPQRLPLRRLLRGIREAVAVEVTTCDVTRAQGYGLEIRALDARLESDDTIRVGVDVVDRLSEGVHEWFWNFDATLSGTECRFGLDDSTALFIEAPREVVDRVLPMFQSYRPAS